MIPKSCLFYRVALTESGTPIPGTMQAYDKEKIKDPCDHALLTPYQMPYTNQCFPDNGFRYFYKVYTNNGNTYILPNSLWQQHGKPKSMCNVREYVVRSKS